MATTKEAKLYKPPLEEELMHALKYGGLDRENLAQIVSIVSSLNTKGIRPVKVFPIGVPNPDGVVVHTLLDAKALQRLVTLLGELPRVSGIEVFPKGIPFPDIFVTEIGIR